MSSKYRQSIQTPFPSLLAIYFLVLLLSSDGVLSFYVPGVAPVEFKKGDPLVIKAVKMTSSQTQLPYSYYSLPFCKPNASKLVYKSENLGEVLRGDRIVSTPYEFKLGQNVACQLACHNPETPLHWKPPYATEAFSHIEHHYFVHMIVDNLPCVTKTIGPGSSSVLGGAENEDTNANSHFHVGYPLGFMSQDNQHAYINNHLDFNILYHTDDEKSFRVVGCEITPSSVNRVFIRPKETDCAVPRVTAGQQNFQDNQEIKANTDNELFFTYSVVWTPSAVREMGIEMGCLSTDDGRQYSLVLNYQLCRRGLVSHRRDIARYNNMEDSAEEALEEVGWKLVHGDVFRPPRYPRLFASLIGSGIQILGMAVVTIFFAMFGMLSPASRGALMSAMIFLYVIMGTFAGYHSSRLYRSMRGKEWKKQAFMTATLFPGIVFGTKPYQHPVRTNQIPRQIPPQPCALMAGILPFGAMFIELFFIYNALWHNQFYYMFGFLFLVFLILLVSVSQIAVVLCYFQLCGEDYHWWWRVLFSSGGSAIYMFFYAVFYFHTRLEITEFIPTLLYFAYTGLMVLTAFLLTGTIGFYSSYIFLTKIYGAVKID
ncbi:Transmembrane 9 superfamily member 4 [Folsomia candida]|uniref:Transmembrane 9 superfamily member n=1 Tax=Folsomia candida TaxID=158441 RepID=A0A226F209_FOLCA|nr:Transmembrane 9 superfamily member 4 [Folsomia candida]